MLRDDSNLYLLNANHIIEPWHDQTNKTSDYERRLGSVWASARLISLRCAFKLQRTFYDGCVGLGDYAIEYTRSVLPRYKK